MAALTGDILDGFDAFDDTFDFDFDDEEREETEKARKAVQTDIVDSEIAAKEMAQQEMESAPPPRKHKGKTISYRISPRYEYRRAFSEVSLLDAMKHEPLTDGTTYNFITMGDVDSLSYLKVVLNQHDLDYLLFSTWCMHYEDVSQIVQWHNDGRIKKFDAYVGELFPSSRVREWYMLKTFFRQHPEVGRVAVSLNHSKVFAGANYAERFFFGIQSSANINTNPRVEQSSITIDKGIFEFYKGFFDKVETFVKTR